MSHGTYVCLYVCVSKCAVCSGLTCTVCGICVCYCVFMCACFSEMWSMPVCVHECVWPRQELVKVNWALDWAVDKGGGLPLRLSLPGVRRCPIHTQQGCRCVRVGIRRRVFLLKWVTSPLPHLPLSYITGVAFNNLTQTDTHTQKYILISYSLTWG